MAVGVPTGGFPSEFSVRDVSGAFPLFIPVASSGSETTCSCDNWNFYASNPCLYVGGNYSQGGGCGLFYVGCTSASSSGGGIGARLMELPDAA